MTPVEAFDLGLSIGAVVIALAVSFMLRIPTRR